MEEPGPCWPESASLEVEGRESLGVLEVDLHRFTTSIGCVPRRKSDQFSCLAVDGQNRTFGSRRKAWSPPSQATLANPTRIPLVPRAVTHPRRKG